ncbi:extracellular solute-binding protein [Streptomyces sp. NBC_00654]|uniref:extracellular solute-binding protein n=1 Tax=Streptomyces sp. NBC_00654 TaxID=2975799 RepID=UPI00225B59AD|nr:extracellular solute-binding protein [Streptomyces sp. NBC_00654]MCX4969577.1 extracellular solute-binding protein [Streptomyces sp. NBC_00654]
MSTTGRDIRGSRWHRTRRLRLVALGALFALAAPACSGGSGGEGPGPDTSGKGPGTTAAGPIVVASGLDVTGSGGVRQQLIEEWNRQHQDDPALRAKLVELPGGADQQRSQLLGALQSGSAAYDVVNLDITWIPEFAEAGLIQALPADEADDPDFIPRVQSTTLWEGRSYARPFNSDVGLLYYRRDLLQNGGITEDRMPNSSWTWESLYASITTLDNGTLDRERGEAGWTTQLRQYEGLTVNTIEAFAAVGVELVRDDGTYRSDPAELKKGLNELLRHADNDRLLPAALSSDENATLADFAAGRVAYLRHWPYAYGALQSLLKPGQYAVTALPGHAVLGGQNLAVTADSPRAENARGLTKFLTSPESERCLLDAGFAATRTSAYEPTAMSRPCWPAVAAALRPAGSAPGAPVTGEGSAQIPTESARAAFTRTLSEALKTAVQRPRTPYYGAFTQVLQSKAHDLLTEGSPDIDAAEELDKALEAAFEGR